MSISRHLGCAIALATLLLAGCSNGKLPASPTPPVEAVTANAYILPGAVDQV
jgi:outer membrane murein-binding lipoprotein Lpp